MKPTKQCRETLISFNERAERVEVITYNTSLIKRLTALSAEHIPFAWIRNTSHNY